MVIFLGFICVALLVSVFFIFRGKHAPDDGVSQGDKITCDQINASISVLEAKLADPELSAGDRALIFLKLDRLKVLRESNCP